MYYNSNKIVGMPVISLNDGHQLGRVKRLLIDPQKMVVAGFTVDRKGWFKEQPVIPYSHVKSVGNHAVTVEQPGAIVRLSSMPELEVLAKQPMPLLGLRVITEDGRILGNVHDFRFLSKDGNIHYLEIKNGLLSSSRVLENHLIITCGRDAVIVKSGSEQTLQKPTGMFMSKYQDTCTNVGRIMEKANRIACNVRDNIKSYWKRLPFINKNQDDPPSNNGN